MGLTSCQTDTCTITNSSCDKSCECWVPQDHSLPQVSHSGMLLDGGAHASLLGVCAAGAPSACRRAGAADDEEHTRPTKRTKSYGGDARVKFSDMCVCVCYQMDEAVTSPRTERFAACRDFDGPRMSTLAMEQSFLAVRTCWSNQCDRWDGKTPEEEDVRQAVCLCYEHVAAVVMAGAQLAGYTDTNEFASVICALVINLLKSIRDGGCATLLPSTMVLGKSDTPLLFLLRRCLSLLARRSQG